MLLKKGILVLAFFAVLSTLVTEDVFAQRERRERAPRERAPRERAQREILPAPVLAQPTEFQALLNVLPPIRVSGTELKFSFGGESWIATLNGRNMIGGSFSTEELEEGIVLRLRHSHTWPPVDLPSALLMRWVPTPGPQIALIYSPGPPRSLRRYVPAGEVAEEDVENAE